MNNPDTSARNGNYDTTGHLTPMKRRSMLGNMGEDIIIPVFNRMIPDQPTQSHLFRAAVDNMVQAAAQAPVEVTSAETTPIAADATSETVAQSDDFADLLQRVNDQAKPTQGFYDDLQEAA